MNASFLQCANEAVTDLETKGHYRPVLGMETASSLLEEISPEFSSRKTHIQKKNHQLLNLPTYSLSDFYGPPIMLP